MSKIPKVRLTIYDRNMHISSIVAGFLMLQNEKKIELKIVINEQNIVPHNCLALAEIEGIKIAFDTLDGYNWNQDLLENFLEKVDCYFKRSYSIEKNCVFDIHLRQKIHPLGFNYHVTYPGNPIDIPHGLNEKVRRTLERVIKGYDNTYFVPDVFENKTTNNNNHKILFMTRLWDPDIESTFIPEELERINDMRIAIIRELKKEYQDNFIGGVKRDHFSQKVCPDLIMNNKYTNRKQYLEIMKCSYICIGSMGLHESIGWKTGEYVAAGRAIVNEEFRYQSPDFIEGVNYLSYNSLEECLGKVKELYQNPDMVLNMQKANQSYYDNYLRPDKQIENALAVAFQGEAVKSGRL